MILLLAPSNFGNGGRVPRSKVDILVIRCLGGKYRSESGKRDHAHCGTCLYMHPEDLPGIDSDDAITFLDARGSNTGNNDHADAQT